MSLREAQFAFNEDCIPVGAIIILNDNIIASARNKNKSFLTHAEIECIKEAEKRVQTKYLDKCEMFVTLKPCLMCHHAIFLSRIRKVFYGAFSNYEKENDFLYRSFSDKKIRYYGGFYEEESLHLLKNFFLNKRKKNVDLE